MKQAVIVDDELQSRNALRDELRGHSASVEIAGEFDSIESALAGIESIRPDIVFLDIHLGDGNGFELLEKLKYRKFRVVFVTAYDTYAVKAFKYNAIDYILKPVNPEEISQALNRVQDKVKGNEPPDDFLQMVKILHAFRNKRLPIAHGDGFTVHNIDDIVRLQADGNYTHVYFTPPQAKIMTSKTLREFEDLLTDHGFERVHHGHLINLAQIARYVNREGGYIVMTDNSTIPVSQRKKASLLKVFNKLAK